MDLTLLRKLTTPSVQYTQGNIKTSAQAQASKTVENLDSFVKKLSGAMASIDETDQDSNRGNLGAIYGQVTLSDDPTRTDYSGHCRLDAQGNTQELEMTGPHETLTYVSKGSHREIHHRKEGMNWAGIVVTEDWVVADGSNVSVKSHRHEVTCDVD